MSSRPPDIGNREQDTFYVFRDYIHFCNQEQTTLNNLLHTQNLLSNNRYNMFNLMFRHIHPQNTMPSPPPPTFFNTTTPPFNFNTMNNTRRRQPRVWRFPNRRESILTPSRETLNPIQEWINNGTNLNINTANRRRRPATMRQFFDHCQVFNYSQDLSNNQITCPISMTDFSNNDICVRLPCNHIFKIGPLLQWFSRARTCPLCRQELPRISTAPNPFDISNNNVSVQTTDISNGFIADVSANSMEALSTALTETLTNRIQNLFNTIDPSNNNLATLFTTNISLVGPRDYRQSPITTNHNTEITRNGRIHGNDPSGNSIIEPVD